MNWKIGLDRYLTTPPDGGFDEYCEEVTERLTDEFYGNHTEWIEENDGVYTKWLNKLYSRETAPKEAAKIIERAYYFH